MKKWLKDNKIIFETLVAASLTVMGVLVSIAAVVVSVNANRLVAQQNELMAQQYGLDRYGAEPVFDVEWEQDENGEPYYVITNTGARIHDGSASCWTWRKGYYDPTGSADSSRPDVCIFGLCYGVSDRISPFDELTQSFRMNLQVINEDGNEDKRKIESIPDTMSLSGFVLVEIYYKNYRNENCMSTIKIDPWITYDYGKEFRYRIYEDYFDLIEDAGACFVDGPDIDGIKEHLAERHGYIN